MSSFNVKKFIKKNIYLMEPTYIWEKVDKDFLKLNNNESTYEIPEDIKIDLQKKLKTIKFNLYPQWNLETIKQWIANYIWCKSNQVLIDNSSCEVLKTILMTITKPWNTIVSLTPSFVLYPTLSKIFNTTLLEVEYKQNFEIPFDELLELNWDIILIANPNNPTWTYINPQTIEKELLQKTNKIVIIDEAYIEFWWKSTTNLINKYPNLIVVRTFSKWFLSAWMKIWYAIANPEFIKQFEKVQSPFHIDVFKQNYIISLLKYKNEILEICDKIIQTRQYFQNKLQDLWFITTNSYWNFVFIYWHNKNISLTKIYEILKKNKIIIMLYPYKIYNAEYLRISIWKKDEMQKIIEIIENFIFKKNC